METRVLPASVTHLNPLLNKVDDWQQKDSGSLKKHALSRLIVVVAGAPFAAIFALYNAFAFTVKAPITLLKYTILIIPVKRDWTTLGTVILPKGFELTEMGKHIYKIVMFTIDIGFCPVMGLISPSANIWVHEKLGLIELNRLNTKHTNPRQEIAQPSLPSIRVPPTRVIPNTVPPPPPVKGPGLTPPPVAKGKLKPTPKQTRAPLYPKSALIDSLKNFDMRKLKRAPIGQPNPTQPAGPKCKLNPPPNPAPKNLKPAPTSPTHKSRELPQTPQITQQPPPPPPPPTTVVKQPVPSPAPKGNPGNPPSQQEQQKAMLDDIKAKNFALKHVDTEDEPENEPKENELTDFEKKMLERRAALRTTTVASTSTVWDP